MLLHLLMEARKNLTEGHIIKRKILQWQYGMGEP